MSRNRPKSNKVVAKNIFFNHFTFEKVGDCNRGHKHTYDHLTILSAGALEVHCDGQVGVLHAPQIFLTPKEKAHQFFALVDGTLVTCVHPLRDEQDGDKIMDPIAPLVDQVEQVDLLTIPEFDQTDVVAQTPLLTDLLDRILPVVSSAAKPMQGICANTKVCIHYFAKAEELLSMTINEPHVVAFLSTGSLMIQRDQTRITHEAPHVMLLPSKTPLKFLALQDKTVLVIVNTFRGAAERPDDYPKDVTLEHASAELQKIFTNIDQQTTEVQTLAAEAGLAALASVESRQ